MFAPCIVLPFQQQDCMGCFEMLSLLLMFVYFYQADGNHYLIETSDNSGEAALGVDYAEPGCIELRKRFSMTCVKEGCMKFRFLCAF